MRNLRGVRLQLLATVSFGALIAASPAPAQQSVTLPSGFWMSTEASYLFATGTSQPLLAPGHFALPAQSDRVHSAFEWQIAVGGPLPPSLDLPGWDFRAAYTGIRSWTHQRSVMATSFHGVATTTNTFHSAVRQRFDIGDFDIGHDVGLGGMPLHAFAGIRAVSFNQADASSVTQTEVVGGEGEHMCSHYFGVGPRIGLDGKYPIGRAGPFAISLAGEVSGSVAFGTSSLDSTFINTSTSGPASTPERGSTNFKPVYNAEAMLGVAFDFPLGGCTGEMTIGYRGQAWWHVLDTKVRDFELAGTGGTSNGNQFYNGPFVQFALKL